jgi:2-polyprenyl-3-methyl-5-hydroxy-6-metoxy-1,4-benzoquinol methylase
MIGDETMAASAGARHYSPGELAALSRSLYSGGPWLLRKLQHWRPLICPFDRLLGHVPEDASVLDVGCGGGLFLALLAATGHRPRGIGFDTAAGAIRLAGDMAGRMEGRGAGSRGILRFERRDFADSWPKGPFDVVSIIDVMHHVPPPHQKSFFQTACRAVRPGGILLYKDMCRCPLWRAMANRLHDLAIALQWIHYAPIHEVERWAEDNGMELLHAERIDRLWYGHELRVFRCRHTGPTA